MATSSPRSWSWNKNCHSFDAVGGFEERDAKVADPDPAARAGAAGGRGCLARTAAAGNAAVAHRPGNDRADDPLAEHAEGHAFEAATEDDFLLLRQPGRDHQRRLQAGPQGREPG